MKFMWLLVFTPIPWLLFFGLIDIVQELKKGGGHGQEARSV